MNLVYIGLIVYFLIAVGFFFAIYRENLKNQYEFNVLQLIVVILWPLWGIWYFWDITREAISNWRTKELHG